MLLDQLHQLGVDDFRLPIRPGEGDHIVGDPKIIGKLEGLQGFRSLILPGFLEIGDDAIVHRIIVSIGDKHDRSGGRPHFPGISLGHEAQAQVFK
jgi:hypothetical protein